VTLLSFAAFKKLVFAAIVMGFATVTAVVCGWILRPLKMRVPVPMAVFDAKMSLPDPDAVVVPV